MAFLARYAHVSPDVFENMLYSDATALARAIAELRKQDMEFTVELTKAQMKASSGVRI